MRPALLIALLVLTACVPATPVAVAPGTTRDSANVGPGTGSVTAALAAETFRTVCVQTLPDFRGAPAVLRARGFAQNTRTTTYYNQAADLSVKLMPEEGGGVCSMVFGSTESAAVLNAVIIATSRDARFAPGTSFQGTDYYRAVLSATN